jgi:5-formyltetrahydrofolate cyclo-ligase
MESWERIQAWKRATRTELLARRMAMPASERERIGTELADLLWDRFPELHEGCIGFYWPLRGEVDLRPLIVKALAHGARAALPVVMEKQRSLEFRAWSPGTILIRGKWDIPIPAERHLLKPTVLLVPMLGHDRAGHRLGYGGGHYDLTLAGMDPRPLAIGVGYERGRLQTIYPQPHDIPLDVVVTETGYARYRRCGLPFGAAGHGDGAPQPAAGKRNGSRERHPPARGEVEADEEAQDAAYVSPACFMHELDPSYFGYWSLAETIAMLQDLLETLPRERGAGGETGFDAVLRRHIVRLGRRLETLSKTFHMPESAMGPVAARKGPLDRDRAGVVRKIQTALPRIGDDALYDDLRQMLETLERQVTT